MSSLKQGEFFDKKTNLSGASFVNADIEGMVSLTGAKLPTERDTNPEIKSFWGRIVSFFSKKEKPLHNTKDIVIEELPTHEESIDSSKNPALLEKYQSQESDQSRQR